MKWFIAKIVFHIRCEDTLHTPQFDEQLRLVAAENLEEAFLKARGLGLRDEDSFFNQNKKTVKWEFINVSEVIAVGKLEDGSEIYSRIHETHEPRTYIHNVHEKARYIRLSQPVI